MSDQNPVSQPAPEELGDLSELNAPERENPGAFKPGYDPRRMGNRGGLGRPRKEIIEQARQSYAARIKFLEDVADGVPQVFIKRIQLKGALVSRDPAIRKAAERTKAEAEANGQGQPVDPNDLLEIRWEESPSTELRVEVVKDLAKMGHMHIPLTPKELEDPTAPDVAPVYTIAID